MTDEVLIKNYLNRYYIVVLGIHSQNDNNIVIGSLKNNATFSTTQINIELNLIFKGIKSIEKIFLSWVNENMTNIVKNFNTFLNDCEVVLGARSWIIIHKQYGEIKQNLIKNYYEAEDKPYLVTIQKLLDDWYDQKIIEVSEKQMRNIYI